MTVLTLLARLLVLGTSALLAAMPAVIATLGWRYLRKRRYGAALVVACSVAAGFLGGGVLVWTLVPATWQMSFQTTLAASVDSATYGHSIEHASENILVCVAFGGMSGSLAARLGAPRKAAP